MSQSLPTVSPCCRRGRACVFDDPWGYAVEPLMPDVQGSRPSGKPPWFTPAEYWRSRLASGTRLFIRCACASKPVTALTPEKDPTSLNMAKVEPDTVFRSRLAHRVRDLSFWWVSPLAQTKSCHSRQMFLSHATKNSLIPLSPITEHIVPPVNKQSTISQIPTTKYIPTKNNAAILSQFVPGQQR